MKFDRLFKFGRVSSCATNPPAREALSSAPEPGATDGSTAGEGVCGPPQPILCVECRAYRAMTPQGLCGYCWCDEFHEDIYYLREEW